MIKIICVTSLFVFAWECQSQHAGSTKEDEEHATPSAPDTGSQAVSRDEPAIVCAFFGLDNALPFGANLLARGAFRRDGMPVNFRDEIEGKSLDSDDFVVIDSQGTRHTPIGAVLRPANEEGENRTVLLLGEFGDDGTNPPIEVQIVGDLLTRKKHPEASAPSEAKNLKGASTKNIITLGNGPKMFFAQMLTGKLVENPADGGQVVQVAWEGGIRPIDKRVEEKDLFKFYVIHVNENGKLIPVTPTSIADIGDYDNFHQLRIDSHHPVAKVSMAAGTVKDPNGDPNPDTEIAVTYAATPQSTVTEPGKPRAFPTRGKK